MSENNKKKNKRINQLRRPKLSRAAHLAHSSPVGPPSILFCLLIYSWAELAAQLVLATQADGAVRSSSTCTAVPHVVTYLTLMAVKLSLLSPLNSSHRLFSTLIRKLLLIQQIFHSGNLFSILLP
jgi:hypothetical protein